jgi:hypothetical protein
VSFCVAHVSKIECRVSRLHNFLKYRHFAVYRIHFRSAWTSVLYSIYICASVQFTTKCTVLYCTSDGAASLKVALIRYSSRFLFKLHIYYYNIYIRPSRLLTAYFPVNRHFAVYRIHFRFARTSVLSYMILSASVHFLQDRILYSYIYQLYRICLLRNTPTLYI